MASPKYRDKYQEAVAKAYKKALNIVQKESPPDSSPNSHVVAAAQLTELFIEINLDDTPSTDDVGGV